MAICNSFRRSAMVKSTALRRGTVAVLAVFRAANGYTHHFAVWHSGRTYHFTTLHSGCVHLLTFTSSTYFSSHIRSLTLRSVSPNSTITNLHIFISLSCSSCYWLADGCPLLYMFSPTVGKVKMLVPIVRNVLGRPEPNFTGHSGRGF